MKYSRDCLDFPKFIYRTQDSREREELEDKIKVLMKNYQIKSNGNIDVSNSYWDGAHGTWIVPQTIRGRINEVNPIQNNAGTIIKKDNNNTIIKIGEENYHIRRVSLLLA